MRARIQHCGFSASSRMHCLHLTVASSSPSPLTCSTRSVVQSGGTGNLRNPVDAYADLKLTQKLSSNGRGNYYRYRQPLWPSEEALERAMTESTYSPVERTPLQMLPQPSRRRAPRRIATCEGPGGTALLEREVELQEKRHPTQQAQPLAVGKEVQVGGGEEVVDSMMMMDDLLLMQQQANIPLSQKIITEQDVDGTLLSSARERARAAIVNDLAHNELMPCLEHQPFSRTLSSTDTPITAFPSARDAAGTDWGSLGLDPLLAQVAAEHYGPVPSRLQARLLPALLNEDHYDVLLNGVTGSGKTSALLLAMLQGVRSESAGLNVLVATNTMTAVRLHDAIRALCRKAGNVGGRLVDRSADDFSWLCLGTYREEYRKYYHTLRRSCRSAHGPARIFITTADVMCELLFEKKMEFEDFGYLRRVYVDDVGAQVPMVPDDAPVETMSERLRNPLAAELLLGTLHQMPGPHIRSLLQLGLVSADIDGDLKAHLTSLCVKPTAYTTVLSPVRVPATVHCLFSFFLPSQDRWAYVAKLVWNARETIPGRAILFARDDEDLLGVRRTLRGHGMDVKLFSEVYGNGEFKERWKFLLLKESEAFGVDIPLVSHVFITFAPRFWRSYQHMCGRTGRLGNVGWVYTVTDKREAKQVRGIADDLDVDFVHHVVDEALRTVPADAMERLTKAPTPYGLDPQYVVQQHQERQAEHPEAAYRKREFFTRPNVNQQFQMENYTPIPEQHRRFTNARRLSRDLEQDPRRVVELATKGLLDEKLRPTARLRRQLDAKHSKFAPSPFEQ